MYTKTLFHCGNVHYWYLLRTESLSHRPQLPCFKHNPQGFGYFCLFGDYDLCGIINIKENHESNIAYRGI